MATDQIRLIPDCKVSVGGKPLGPAFDGRLTTVEVDLDSDLFGCCSLVFHDPQLTLINGKEFASGVAVEVKIGFAQKLERVFQGEVVALEPMFRRDLPPSLRVICFESLHRLALTQMTRALNNVDDKEIVTRIAHQHGLSAAAPSGTREHHLQSATTDAVLLRRLAQKKGNVLRMEGTKLIVGEPKKGAQVKLSPGEGLKKLRVRLSSAQQIGEVTVHGWDPKTKKEIVATAKPQGEIGAGGRKHGGSASLAVAGHEPQPADTATAEAMAKGRLRKLAEGFIEARVDMIGDSRVVPGALVELEKMGPQVDGSYRVDHAEHRFSRHGYFVKFRGVRVQKKAPAKKALQAGQAGAQSTMSGAEEAAAKDRAKHGLTNPRWGKTEHEHADSGEMIVDCKNIDGKVVEFIAYHQEPDGNWTEFVRKHVIAQGTQVKANIKLLHEDHPDAAKATKGSKRKLPEMLSNPRWGKTNHDHGDEAQMMIDVRHGHDGEAVVFEVERKLPSGWTKFATVETKVDGDQAKVTVPVFHPGSEKDSGAPPDQPAELRFQAHLTTQSGPRAVKFEANVL